MAELEVVRFSELPGAAPLSGPELIPMVQNGATVIREASSVVLEAGLQTHIDAVDPHPQYEFRVKSNLTATVDPSTTNDSTEGYEPTSRWVNTVTNEFFICINNSIGSANWQQATLTLDELGSAALADTGAGNGLDADLLDGEQGSYYQAWVNVTGKPSPTITVDGGATGSVILSSLTDGTLTLTIVDNSHNHIIGNVSGLQTELDNKVDKVTGKGLSTEDYTTADKDKLTGIEENAQVNVATNLGQSRDSTSYTITSSTGVGTTLLEATQTNAGVISAADKVKLDEFGGGSVPVGIITMWSGAIIDIPIGWVVCDGLNSTPDLRDRFIVGAGGSYEVGVVGGSADAVIVSHNHTASTGSSGTHSHSGSTSLIGDHTHGGGAALGTSGGGSSTGGPDGTQFTTRGSGAHSHSLSINSTGSHTHTVSVASSGESGVNKNLPPYYALAYIMKT